MVETQIENPSLLKGNNMLAGLIRFRCILYYYRCEDLLLCSGIAERTPHALCLYGPVLSSCQADSGHVPTQQSEASLDTIPSSHLV
jgi:hypothetical protein